jgi:HAD superfamily hydrolase (TIGR01450 family)
MRHMRAYDGYVFDLDGTIYLGDTLLPTVAETLSQLRAQGRRIVFLSNNPTRTREQYVTKLRNLGIAATLEEVVNSSHVLVQWLHAHAPGTTVYALGEAPLLDELAAAGFTLSEDPAAIRFVVASFDRTLVYHKLQVGFDALRAGARLIATNADRYCPVPGGGQPDAAAVIAALEACSGTTCELVVGKPSPIMAHTVSSMLGLAPNRCVMVGDRLETDIAMGAQAGMDTALVLTGASRRTDLSPAMPTPTYILEVLADIQP